MPEIHTGNLLDYLVASGYVVGPAVSTDNGVARWDGITGQLLQDSGITIDDGDNLDVPGNISVTGAVDGRDVSVDGAALDTAVSDLATHISDLNNPHATSIANIGSGTKAELDAAISDAELVAGPAGATDHAFPRFDGATGELLEDSLVLCDDIGNLSGVGNITLSGTVDGRDISTDGATLDAHVASTANPHATSIANIGSGTKAELDAAISDAELVSAPAGATDNAIARFDGVTGEIIQNSGVTIDDANNVTTPAIVRSTKYELDGNTVYTGRAGNDLTLTDPNAGTVTLTQLKSMRNVWIVALAQAEGDRTLADATNWATQYSYISSIKVRTTSTSWDLWLFETSAFNLALITTRKLVQNRNGDFDTSVAREYNSDSNNVYVRFTDNVGAATFDILIVGEARRH